MIIVLARAEFDPARLDEIEPALEAMMRATWDESGCLSYSMAMENRAEGICTIVERWRSEADMKAHFTTPHMEAFKLAIAGVTHSIDAKMYEVVNERALMV